MSDHTCKTLTAGCYRCSLNMDELVGAAEMERDEARALAREMAEAMFKACECEAGNSEIGRRWHQCRGHAAIARAKEAGML